MTPEERKYFSRRLGEIIEFAEKNVKETKDRLEERKRKREERMERLLDRR